MSNFVEERERKSIPVVTDTCPSDSSKLTGKNLQKEDIESLYAKPMKKIKRENVEEVPAVQKEVGSGLYAEIMDHINKSKNQEKPPVYRPVKKPVSDYATIDEVMPSSVCSEGPHLAAEKTKDSTSEISNTSQNACPKFATISKNKKMTVMAASTEKIYETYLSFGKKKEVERFRKDLNTRIQDPWTPLSQRCKSQPDVFTGQEMKVYDVTVEENKKVSESSEDLTLSSSKPAVNLETKPHCSSFKGNCSFDETGRLPDLPGTPVIMATPSFDSLCSDMSHSSGSPRSMQDKSVSGSAESLSGKSNHSELTSSSLSMSPDHKDDISVTVPKEILPLKQNNITESQNAGIVPQPSGKPNALKNGIDLSVYLLKPKTGDTKAICTNVIKIPEQNCKLEGNSYNQPLMSTFKDTLSGVITKVAGTPVKTSAGVRTERRHTVQTVTECKPPVPHKPSQIPSIGIAAKSRTITRQKDTLVTERRESGNKRDFEELQGEDHQYLETDIDCIGHTDNKQPMKKSKSLGRFETDSDTVVTEIW